MTLESSLDDSTRIPVPQKFLSEKNYATQKNYELLLKEAEEDYEAFWSKQAKEHISWFSDWNTVVEQKNDHHTWFSGATLNASYNCLDRHIPTKANKKALIWEGESGESRSFTFSQLLEEVSLFCHSLSKITTGNEVITIYMPLVPEAIIAMLGVARMGLMHNVVFAGFSAEALLGRLQDSKSEILITADCVLRGGKSIPLKVIVDEALKRYQGVKTVLVFDRKGNKSVSMLVGRDFWWDDFVEKNSKEPLYEAKVLDSEHPLFMLYTSGSTGKPKGVLHTTGGYLLGASYTAKLVFDLQDDDIFWCTADIGWITGHTYVVYGALSNGVTSVIYEGAPSTPHWGRFWEIIERHKVTKFYTAPTAIRALVKNGPDLPNQYDLSSLRLLGSVGEPISPETWMWFFKTIGGSNCPVVDTWWQTETGSIMIAPVPGVTETKPGSATRLLPGIFASIVDESGNAVQKGEGGYLLLERPWPSMARSIFGDHKRYLDTYFSRFPGRYLTGDEARQDKDGYFWILGRIDDVINVSGHRLSTMEIESALVGHGSVAEAAVIGIADELTGEAIVCFVTLKNTVSSKEALAEAALREHIVKTIGALARPKRIILAPRLPKTRSGKIMRRLLRELAVGKTPTGDLSTIEDPEVLEELLLLTRVI